MMIEIRELVIRATVEDASSRNESVRDFPVNGSRGKSDCCRENMDQILKMLKEKRER